MIEVRNEIRAYEIDGELVSVEEGEAAGVVITSHQDWDDCVVLKMFGRSLTLTVADLHAAISNATNVNRYRTD